MVGSRSQTHIPSICERFSDLKSVNQTTQPESIYSFTEVDNTTTLSLYIIIPKCTMLRFIALTNQTAKEQNCTVHAHFKVTSFYTAPINFTQYNILKEDLVRKLTVINPIKR